jgi:hypothetical protein
MQLSEIIQQNDDGEEPVIEVTQRVVKIILGEHRSIAEQLLIKPIRNVVRDRRRHLVRRAEDAAFGPADDISDSPEDALTALRKLATETFWDPTGGGYVSYQDATAAQHAAYADYLRHNQIRPLLINAERHEIAVEILADAQKDCLRDLPDW